MKSRLPLVTVAILMIIGLLMTAGCQTSPAPAPAPAPAPKPSPSPAPSPTGAPSPAEFKWPSSMTVVVMGGSANPGYGATVAWTNLLAAEKGIRFSVLGEVRVDTCSEMLKTKKAEISTAGTSPDYLMANGSFATREGGSFPIRIISSAAEVEAGFMTKKDSPIKTPQDIKKGTRMANVIQDPAFMRYNNALLAWAQVPASDIVFVNYATPDAALDGLIEGKVDIAWSSPLLPGAMKVMSSPGGGAWIALDSKKDPEGARRFLSVQAFYIPGFELKTGVGKGVIGMVAYGANFSTKDVSEDLIYNLVKWLDINYDKIKVTHPWNESITPQNLLRLAEFQFIPVHEGAVKFLREKGLWTDKHQQRWQYNADLLDKYQKAYADAIKQADARGIPVNPENKAWLDFWDNYKKEQKLPVMTYFPGL